MQREVYRKICIFTWAEGRILFIEILAENIVAGGRMNMKGMKAVPYLLLVAGTAISMALAPLKPASKAPSGGPSAEAVTMEGSAKGMDGDVAVKVVADKDYIYSVEVTDQHETEGIGTIAVDQLPSIIYNSQSYNVDAVSGATITSNAIMEATKAALATQGLESGKFAEKASGSTVKRRDSSYQADVVVIGAGGAGMTAAIEAADRGEKVMLLERESMVGGNSIRATGGINASKTVYQDENEFAESDGVEKTLETARTTYADNKAIMDLAAKVEEQWKAYKEKPEGYFDSVELMELDTMIGGKGTNNPDLVKTLCKNSAPAIDWLDSIGAKLHNVGAFGGASVKRIHRPVDAEGKTIAVGSYIVPILEQNVKDRSNIRLFYSTTADKILMQDGKAVGVHAIGETGENMTFHARAVIVATGGFGANYDMIAKYRPDLKDYMSTNADGSQGDGIVMGEDVGAATVDLDQIQIHPTVEANTAHLITEGLRGDGAILVNSEAKRFTDEVGTRDVVSAAEIEQPGQFAWLIMDQSMADASAVIQGYINAGYTKTGNSYRELAEAIEVDPATFEQTMNTWNGYVADQKDPDCGRTSFTKALDTAPYYAIKVTPGIHHTMGGLVIDSNTEVLDKNNKAIEGLFAAGEVTGGVHGKNRLGGNAVADFTVYGRIAGQRAADYADGQ